MRTRWTAWNRLLPIALVLLGLIGPVIVSACGDDPYSGTWRATTARGDHVTIRIEKDGDAWVVTNSQGESVDAVEKDGRLVVVGPKNIGLTYERVDDVLRQRVDGAMFHDYLKQ